MYKVVIPSAGKGTRLKDLSKHINKALVSVNQKPSISYVVEKFPENIEIVVPLGYKGDDIKDFLEIAYPNRKFSFVDVDLFEGPGSGLGYSLLKCKEILQCPFIFIPNDSILEEDIPEPNSNWMGYSSLHTSEEYRSISIVNENVDNILPKGSSGNIYPYIGLCAIKDYELFWKHMDDGLDKGAIEIGESYGLKMLLSSSEIKAKKFTWHDTGNLVALENAKKMLPKNKIDAHILDKPDEAIWFCQNKVIKFHVDKNFIADRVQRSKNLGNFVPKIQKHADHMYSYNIVKGSVLSRNPTPKIFKSFLNFMSEFWSNPVSKDFKIDNFYKGCSIFYKDKTYERLELFLKRFEVIDRKMIVNGELIPCYKDVLGLLDWSDISKGIPVRFHGDLHFENILCTEEKNNPFCLLDWRQNFAGDTDVGDIYYDLAKLNHGLIISHEIINNNHFDIDVHAGSVSFDFHRKNLLFECQEILKEWVDDNKYDWSKVKKMTNLIFLNISPLHDHPYSLLLYYFGLSSLWNDLNK
tara:strand:+ start:7133 stop:8704 length:1572 start_codon:yes stop_codon:yes gene_type:complete